MSERAGDHANGPPAAAAEGMRIEVVCRGGERVAVPRERAEKCAFLLGMLEECEADDAAGPLTVRAPLVEAPRLEAVLRILGGERAGAGMCVRTYAFGAAATGANWWKETAHTRTHTQTHTHTHTHTHTTLHWVYVHSRYIG